MLNEPNQPTRPSLASLNDIQGYTHLFMDVETWRPHIEHIWESQSLRSRCISGRGGMSEQSSALKIRPGLAGTFPTFIVDESLVVKFFGKLFDGWESYAVERTVSHLLTEAKTMPAPALIQAGQLDVPNDDWFYLVFSCVPGISIGEIRPQLSWQDWLDTARQMGGWLKELHALPLPSSPVHRFSPASDAFRLQLRSWFSARQVEGKLGLPAHLAIQAQDYLERVDKLAPPTAPLHLIHADLTQDHLLGQFQADKWRTLAVIDFGDAMAGDFYYELAALYFDLFGGEIRLLETFLQAYQLPPSEKVTFPERCLAAALQHQFNVFEPLFNHHPELLQTTNLEALAEALYACQ